MGKYVINTIDEKIVVNDNYSMSFDEIIEYKDNKLQANDTEIQLAKVSYDRNDTFNAGDTFISPESNIAYYFTGEKWVEVGELMLKNGVQNISSGENYSLFLLIDGTVKAVGGNGSGQLGDGTTTTRYTPVLVSGVTDCIGISAGITYVHSLFLLADGTVKSCGRNDQGQLGTGDTTNRSTPVLVSGVSNCISVSAGYMHSLFLLEDGTVKACGYNNVGQLGDGTTNTYRNTPYLVSGVTNCIGVSAGNMHSLFLLSDGTVKSVGSNSYGQLGDGNTATKRNIPVLNLITNCISISCGYDHSLFLLADGTVKSCGFNQYGQLGDGTTTTRYTPVLVSGVSGCNGISAGSYDSLFLLSNGTVKGCGYNNKGQLGDGNTTTQRNTPYLVSGISDCIGVSVSNNHTLFLLADGTVKACGYNNYGQLWDGSRNDKRAPILTIPISVPKKITDLE